MTADIAGPSAKLCQWACSTRHEDLPLDVRKEALTVLYDTLGGMIAAATLPTCQPVVDVVRKLGPAGPCSIIGHPLRASVTNAALANGTIGHGDETDATGQHGTGHFAAVIVPTALTTAQYVGASGQELMRSIALGCEVAGRFVSLLGHYNTRPEFAPSVGHTMGAVVSAGVLFGLNPEQMENALGIGAAGACGLYSHHYEELHQVNSLEAGRAAEAGVLAGLLAQVDYHGPKEPLTIEHGYFGAFLGSPSLGNEVVKELGDNYLMRQIAYKRYSVGAPDQAPLHAFLQLIKTHQLKADDIAEIEISLAHNAFITATTNKGPSVHMETIFRLAAIYGDVTFAHIHNPRYREDPRVKAFAERVRILLIPRPGPATKEQRLQAAVTVRTGNGKTLKLELRHPLMTEAEIQQKFRNLAVLRLSSDRVVELERKLKAIETERNVASLISELEIPY